MGKRRGLAQFLVYGVAFGVGLLAGWYIGSNIINTLKDYLTFSQMAAISSRDVYVVRDALAIARLKAFIEQKMTNADFRDTLEKILQKGVVNICGNNVDACNNPPFCWICRDSNFIDYKDNWPDNIVKEVSERVEEAYSSINYENDVLTSAMKTYGKKRDITKLSGGVFQAAGKFCPAIEIKHLLTFGMGISIKETMKSFVPLTGAPCVDPVDLLTAVASALGHELSDPRGLSYTCGTLNGQNYAVISGKVNLDLSTYGGSTVSYKDLIFKVKSLKGVTQKSCEDCFSGVWFEKGTEAYPTCSSADGNLADLLTGCCCGDDPGEVPGICNTADEIPEWWVGGCDYLEPSGENDEWCCSFAGSPSGRACLIANVGRGGFESYSCHASGEIVESPYSSCKMHCLDGTWKKLDAGAQCDYGIECSSGICKKESTGGVCSTCDAAHAYEEISAYGGDYADFYDSCNPQNEELSAENAPWWCSCYTAGCSSFQPEPKLQGKFEFNHNHYLVSYLDLHSNDPVDYTIILEIPAAFGGKNIPEVEIPNSNLVIRWYDVQDSGDKDSTEQNPGQNIVFDPSTGQTLVSFLGTFTPSSAAGSLTRIDGVELVVKSTVNSNTYEKTLWERIFPYDRPVLKGITCTQDVITVSLELPEAVFDEYKQSKARVVAVLPATYTENAPGVGPQTYVRTVATARQAEGWQEVYLDNSQVLTFNIGGTTAFSGLSEKYLGVMPQEGSNKVKFYLEIAKLDADTADELSEAIYEFELGEKEMDQCMCNALGGSWDGSKCNFS